MFLRFFGNGIVIYSSLGLRTSHVAFCLTSSKVSGPKGVFIVEYASFLGLSSLLENARLRKERLNVCFIDTQKAFPSVRRDFLLQQLARAAISTAHVLYSDTRACVRSAARYGGLF